MHYSSFDAEEDTPVSAVDFKQHVLQNLKNVFGEVSYNKLIS